MTEYDAEAFEARARAGDWKAQITVLTRSSVDSEVLAAIMSQPEIHDQVMLAIIGRRDSTSETMDWAARRTSSAVVLNRIVQSDKTDPETIKAIRAGAAGPAEDRWRYLVEHADRQLKRRLPDWTGEQT